MEEEEEEESSNDSSSRRRSRKKSRSSGQSKRQSSSRNKDSDSDSGTDDSRGGRQRKSSPRKISEDVIKEYLIKKAQKKALKVNKKLKSQKVSGYSNDSNPFGDSNLNEKFFWRKKIERDVGQGLTVEQISVKAEKKKQKERMACLKEIHTNLLRKHLQRLEHPVESEQHLDTDHDSKREEEDTMDDVEEAQPYSPEPIMAEPTNEMEEEPGSFSPELMHAEDNEDAIDPEDDRVELERKRVAVLEEQQRRLQEAMAVKSAQPEDNMEMKVMKAMGTMEEGDAVFGSGAEVNLESQVYWWHDKYRPRKPKYFNRVHTGYEWNKYNQTHYDHDNPPPKIVQGYKFNIFYPDLVDKTKAPGYTIEKDGSSGETCLIRFHAGPPYEDIAFRIVNKEWEYSHKKGFKCTFERGILHVYFNFKRYRYRR